MPSRSVHDERVVKYIHRLRQKAVATAAIRDMSLEATSCRLKCRCGDHEQVSKTLPEEESKGNRAS